MMWHKICKKGLAERYRAHAHLSCHQIISAAEGLLHDGDEHYRKWVVVCVLPPRWPTLMRESHLSSTAMIKYPFLYF